MKVESKEIDKTGEFNDARTHADENSYRTCQPIYFLKQLL
jgi:hypothetical protein